MTTSPQAVGRPVPGNARQGRRRPRTSNLGEVELRRGRHREAARHLRRAIALFRELNDKISETGTLASLGLVELRQGHHERAESRLQQALTLCQETGDLSSEAAAERSR
jgi:tetratricopeptide (TPR) repeat protein